MELCGKDIRFRGQVIRTAFLDGEGYQFLEDPETVLKALRTCKMRIDLFTFIQRVSEGVPKYAYPMEWDNAAVLPISSFENWLTRQIGFKVRNKINKAQKSGVVVREVPFDAALVRGITNIYNEYPIRQGKPFWHYGKDMEAVRRINSTFMDQSIFIGAFLDEDLIGFVKLVTDEHSRQAGLMQIFSMLQHRDRAPTNALVAQAVRSCTERKISYLWYANFSYGKKQHDSLADFKRHNGFQKVDVPRYYVPLSVAGRVALSLGLHHPLTDHIPESVASKYRRIRSFWYKRKFQATTTGNGYVGDGRLHN